MHNANGKCKVGLFQICIFATTAIDFAVSVARQADWLWSSDSNLFWRGVGISKNLQGQAMSKSDRRIDIEEISGVTVARLLEKKILDEANIDALGQELFALVDKDGRKKIVLDFTLVEYLSSAALGKLITMHKKTSTAGGKLALCSIQKDILDVFKITQLNKVLTLCNNLDDALKIFG